MKKILDTNILLDYPQIIENAKLEDGFLIPIGVLREIDGLKQSENPVTSCNARAAAVYVSKNLNNLLFDTHERRGTVDEQLMEIAKETDGQIITNDVSLKVIAKIRGINCCGFSRKDNYGGVEYWLIDTEEEEDFKRLNDAFDNGIVPKEFNLFENQYLIVKNKNAPIINKNKENDYETLCIFVYRDNVLHTVYGGDSYKDYSIHNMYIDKIRPRNIEQICLFEALNNRDITILHASSSFGCGKSFVLNNFALQELENGKIRKIVYIPNNSFTENTMDIGALPG